MTKVAVFGSLNHDITVTVPRMPRSDETLIAEGIAEFCGGKGFNQAVAAARLGASVTMIGAVGQDGAGDLLVEALRRNHVDGSMVTRVTEHTGTAVITTDGSDVTIVIVPGANGLVDPALADTAHAAMAACDVLIVQGEVASEATARAASITRAAGGLVVFSPAPVRADASMVLAYATHVVANDGEARSLGLEPSEQVVITRGALGALIGDRLIPIFPATAIDPTGAGDAFTAAFAVGLAEGCDVYEATRRGNAAGSWAVRIAGAEPSMPTREQIQRVLDRG